MNRNQKQILRKAEDKLYNFAKKTEKKIMDFTDKNPKKSGWVLWIIFSLILFGMCYLNSPIDNKKERALFSLLLTVIIEVIVLFVISLVS